MNNAKHHYPLLQILLLGLVLIFGIQISFPAFSNSNQTCLNSSFTDTLIVNPPARQLFANDAGLSVLLTWKEPIPFNKSRNTTITNTHEINKNMSDLGVSRIDNIDELKLMPSFTFNKDRKDLEYPNLIYDNGPFINGAGAGPNGSDLSILQSESLNMSTHGAGVQHWVGYTLADDFTLNEASVIESFTFYAYQTGSTIVSAIDEAYIQIWDGDPRTNGQIIWGDMTTNILSATYWSNTYRVSETNIVTTRPIMNVTCVTPQLILQPGTYWVQFSLDGSLDNGPWAIPITINGVSNTGDAIHISPDGWTPYLDGNTNEPQGFPFVIQGIIGNGNYVNGILSGYKLLRDGELIATLGPETTTYHDQSLQVGNYTYSLIALYDLPYPGESNPLTTKVIVTEPATLPFIETWDKADFQANKWTFSPIQANWKIELSYGNPAPTSRFFWSPGLGNYDVSLISNFIDATQTVDNVTLQFDILLSSYSNVGSEKLLVSIWDGNDWILLESFSNTSSIPWTTKIYDITPHALNKLTKIKFEAKGINSTNIHYWDIDNIKVYEGASNYSPKISVHPTDLKFWVPLGGSQTKSIDIKNIGIDPLYWMNTIQYDDQHQLKTGFSQTNLTNSQSETPHSLALTPNEVNETDTVLLHYDSEHALSMGLTNGGYFYAAVRFPVNMTSSYEGYSITSVDIFIKNAPINSTLYIWNKGSEYGPGKQLHRQAFTTISNSWNTIILDPPVAITSQDIWIGYTSTHAAGKPPAGCDEGPSTPNGNWISTDGINWQHLTEFDFDANWNIRARAQSSSYNWINLSQNSGTVYPDDSQQFTVTANASDLPAGTHHANIIVASNDPDTPYKKVPVELNIGVGLNANEQDTFTVFPIPANEKCTIELNIEFKKLRIINSIGEIMTEMNVAGEKYIQLNTQTYSPGAYILQLISAEGYQYNKSILIKR